MKVSRKLDKMDDHILFLLRKRKGEKDLIWYAMQLFL